MDKVTLTKIAPPDPKTGAGERSKGAGAKEGESFASTLEESLGEVNELQNRAEEAIQELAQGRTQDLHRTMIMIEKAELSFKLMMKVRNKLLDAYQEIMRLQV